MLEILKGFSIADWVLIIGVLLNSAYNFITDSQVCQFIGGKSQSQPE